MPFKFIPTNPGSRPPTESSIRFLIFPGPLSTFPYPWTRYETTMNSPYAQSTLKVFQLANPKHVHLASAVSSQGNRGEGPWFPSGSPSSPTQCFPVWLSGGCDMPPPGIHGEQTIFSMAVVLVVDLTIPE